MRWSPSGFRAAETTVLIAKGDPESRTKVHAGTATSSGSLASNRTETSFETPASSIVTPYKTGQISMVRLLCVMRRNCVCELIC